VGSERITSTKVLGVSSSMKAVKRELRTSMVVKLAPILLHTTTTTTSE